MASASESPSLINKVNLTYDTLLHVISVSFYASEAINLIATCRFLHHQGAKIALKKVVVIHSTKHLSSFLKFLRAEDLIRCKHLRQLQLRDCHQESEPDLIRELAQTILRLINLESLRLYGAEDLLKIHPALLLAFAELTSLRHLMLSGVGGVTCELLFALRTPFITANLEFLQAGDDEELQDYIDFYECTKHHPTMLLTNFAPTLEELQCIASFTTSETILPEKIYTNLRKLSIELRYDFPLLVDPLIRAFPNLTDLHILTEYHIYTVTDMSVESMRESREINVAAQEHSGTWHHLEHFSGCLGDLFALGLICPIHRLSILGAMDDGPGTDMLAAALRAAQPAHLKLESITGLLLGNFERGFTSMLRDESESSLLNLDMTVSFVAADRNKDLRILIDDLISALVRLPLKFLELKFNTDELDPTWERNFMMAFIMSNRPYGSPTPPRSIPEPLTPAELSLRAMSTGMDAFIARLETVPSLEAARFVLPSSRSRGKDYTRTFTKGTSSLPVDEQWNNWLPRKSPFGWC